MRARLALIASGQVCELREVVLRDKPVEMLQASPKSTVPVLIDSNGRVIDESLEIMLWALRANDPLAWLGPTSADMDAMLELVEQCDGEFKANLDRYKYPDRYAGADREVHRARGSAFLRTLDERLDQGFLFGSRASLADMAIAPFVRQFANTDDTWFADQPWPRLMRWLHEFVTSALYERAMHKYARWQPGAELVRFPAE
jgi:glutathione S-transferase